MRDFVNSLTRARCLTSVTCPFFLSVGRLFIGVAGTAIIRQFRGCRSVTGLPVGPFREVFQIVEERFPRYGRMLTSVASLLIVIGIVAVCLTLIAGIIVRALSFIGIVHLPALPLLPLPSFHGSDILLWVLVRLVHPMDLGVGCGRA